MLYLLVGFSVSGFLILACFLLLCSVKVRKSRVISVNKALNEITRISTTKIAGNSDSLNEFQTSMNEDIFTTRGWNEPQVPYRSLTDPSYSYKRPILGQQSPNMHFMQREIVPTVNTLHHHSNVSTRNSSPPVLVHNHTSFDPMTGQVMVQMTPYPQSIPGLPGQLGGPPQHAGLQAQLNELSHTPGHSYIKMPKEGGTNERFPEHIGVTPQGQLYIQRHNGSLRKSLSRHNDPTPRSSWQSNRESSIIKSQKQFRYFENSRTGLENSNYLSNPSLQTERRSLSKKKKKKHRNSKKRKLKKSRSSVARLSSSEEETVRGNSPRSYYTYKSIHGGPGVPDDSSSSSKERIASPRTVSAQTRSVRSIKAKKPSKNEWSKDDIMRMVNKETEMSSIRLLVSADDIDQTQTDHTNMLGFNLSTGKENSEGSGSESSSNSLDSIGQRENIKSKSKKPRPQRGKVMKTLALEPISSSSSSDDSKASTESERILPKKGLLKDSSLIMVSMEEAAVGLKNAGIKIPKSMGQFEQEWQKGMLDTVAEKYFDKEFLEGGVLPLDVSGLNSPSGADSPSVVDSPRSGQDSSSESSGKNDLGGEKLPKAVLAGGSSEML